MFEELLSVNRLLLLGASAFDPPQK